jgi:hypothetical protein
MSIAALVFFVVVAMIFVFVIIGISGLMATWHNY